MNNPLSTQVAVYLPIDLVEAVSKPARSVSEGCPRLRFGLVNRVLKPPLAKMEEVKQDREEDRNKSIQQLLLEFCQSYVEIREAHRWEREHAEQSEHVYSASDEEEDGIEEWADVYPEDKEDAS